MSQEDAFLTALLATIVGTLFVTFYIHRPLRKLLPLNTTAERAAFWLACIDVILMLTPLLGLFLSRALSSNRLNPSTLVLADLLWGPVLGLVLGVSAVAVIVSAVVHEEPEWEARMVPRRKTELPRLLDRVDSMRARNVIVAESKEEEMDPRTGTN